MTMATPSLIDLQTVTVLKAGDHSRPILKDIDLTINPGEILTIIGPNGAGKTTLLQIILGLIQPTSGTIRTHATVTFGYMPQKLHLNPLMPLTVERFLQLATPKANRRLTQVIPEILAEVGATRLQSQQLNTLSGGELQRVMLAYALMGTPNILVLDEPAQGVDVVGQMELYQLIASIRQRRGCAVILVSHDLHLVMAASDRVICLNGHICCSGNPQLVQDHPSYRELFNPLAPYTHNHDHRHDEGCDGGHSC